MLIRWVGVLGSVLRLGVLLIGTSMQASTKELPPEAGKNAGKQITSLPDKPCFLVDPGKLPRSLKPNKNVTCVPDGPQAFPPIPDLTFQGIKYSSIDFTRSRPDSPEQFAFRQFKISTTDGKEKAEYLKTCQQLYESVWMGLRSIDVRSNMISIREIETIIAFLNFQIHRLESDQPAIEAALHNALKRCYQCVVKHRYNLIALASQSGVDPDKFLKDLHGLRCKSWEECLSLLSGQGQATGNIIPLEEKTQNNLITSNPATSMSPKNEMKLFHFFIRITIFISLYLI